MPLPPDLRTQCFMWSNFQVDDLAKLRDSLQQDIERITRTLKLREKELHQSIEKEFQMRSELKRVNVSLSVSWRCPVYAASLTCCSHVPSSSSRLKRS